MGDREAHRRSLLTTRTPGAVRAIRPRNLNAEPDPSNSELLFVGITKRLEARSEPVGLVVVILDYTPQEL